MQRKLGKKIFRLDTLLGTAVPLALVGCGGGGGGGVVNTGASGSVSGTAVSGSVSGTAVKGPLSSAIAFIDANDNNKLDSGELFDETDASGRFSISGASSGRLVVTSATDGSTVDTSSGLAVSGLMLSAPDGAQVVSPLTTLMDIGGLTANNLIDGLGLPSGVDPLAYNPYASGVDSNTALAVEKLAHQVNNTITAIQNATSSLGLDAGDAFSLATESLAEAAKTATASGGLDLTSSDASTGLGAVLAEVNAGLGSIDSASNRTFLDTIATAVKNVNSQVALASDLSGEAAKAIFGLGSSLVSQVVTASQKEADTPGSGAADVTFKSASAVSGAAGSLSEARTVEGVALIGRLDGALVYLDKNGNGERDQNEQAVRTDENGGFSFETSVAVPQYVVVTDGGTVNTSSGAVASGLTLVSAGGSVASPITTLIANTTLSASEVADRMGFSDSIDLANFDPFSVGAPESDGLLYLRQSHQLMVVNDVLKAGLAAAGVNPGSVGNIAAEAIFDVLEGTSVSGGFALSGNTGEQVITAILDSAADASGAAGFATSLTDAIESAVVNGMLAVTTQIQKVTDFSADTSAGAGALSNGSLLAEQVSEAIKLSDASQVTFTVAENVINASTNAAPTNIAFFGLSENTETGTVIDGDSQNLVLKLVAEDDNDLEVASYNWNLLEIEGTDYASFTFIGDDEGAPIENALLGLKSTPDYDVQKAYTVAVAVTDLDGKTFAETLLIEVDLL